MMEKRGTARKSISKWRKFQPRVSGETKPARLKHFIRLSAGTILQLDMGKYMLTERQGFVTTEIFQCHPHADLEINAGTGG